MNIKNEKHVRALINQMTDNLAFRSPTSPTGITMKHDDVKWEILKADLKPETKTSLHHLNNTIRDAMVLIHEHIVSIELNQE